MSGDYVPIGQDLGDVRIEGAVVAGLTAVKALDGLSAAAQKEILGDVVGHIATEMASAVKAASPVRSGLLQGAIRPGVLRQGRGYVAQRVVARTASAVVPADETARVSQRSSKRKRQTEGGQLVPYLNPLVAGHRDRGGGYVAPEPFVAQAFAANQARILAEAQDLAQEKILAAAAAAGLT